MDYIEGCGRHVRRFREQAGLTQDKLAEGVGVSTKYISDIETGKKNVSVGVLADICKYLRIPAYCLLTGKKPNLSKESHTVLEGFTEAELISLLNYLKNNE